MPAYVQFDVGEQRYAVPVVEVVEVLHLVDITPVPGQPADQLGMITWRGQLIPVIDLAQRYTGQYTGLAINTPIIVLQIDDRLSAFVINRVWDVVELADTPEESPSAAVRGILRYAETMVIIPRLTKFPAS